MVRVKAIPKKRNVDDFIVSIVYDAEPEEHCKGASHIPPQPVTRWQLDITMAKTSDENWVPLAKQLLFSCNSLSLMNVKLEYTTSVLTITCETNEGVKSFCRRHTAISIIHDLKRNVRSGNLCFSCYVEDSSYLYLTVLAKVQDVSDSDRQPFRLSPELCNWLTGSSLLCTSNEDVGGMVDTFSSPLLLKAVCQYSTSAQSNLITPHSTKSYSAKLSEKMRTAGLLPDLREYQLQGVLWMAQREGRCLNWRSEFDTPRQHDEAADTDGCNEVIGCDLQGWSLLPKSSPPLWVSEQPVAGDSTRTCDCVSTSGTVSNGSNFCDDIWFNSLTGEGLVLRSSSSPPFSFLADSEETTPEQCLTDSIRRESGVAPKREWLPVSDCLIRGGILADEPGLGKTVELLGLIVLLHSSEELETVTEVGVQSTEELCGLQAIGGSGESSSLCMCNRETFKSSLHYGWVQCDICDSYVHVACAGFASVEEAAACSKYECLICACCRLSTSPLISRTTLVVVPGSLLGQWEREIQRHTDPSLVSFTVYLGLKHAEEGPARESPRRIAKLHPRELSSYMIVLTSFEVLAAELYRSDSPYAGQSGKPNHNSTRKFFDPVDVSCPRSLRSEKKYRFAPSPLLCVQWGRVCLDEAQLVEGTATAAARMAHKLHSRVRWCVSGTPVGKSQLEDLYGLFFFLQQRPLCDKYAWRVLIENAMRVPIDRHGDKGNNGVARRQSTGMMRLQAICSKLMLRRSKESVNGQLNLPAQELKIRRLRLGAVERHFYQKQHDDCISALSDAAGPTGDITDLSLKLLMLRQAACHPQLGSKGISNAVSDSVRRRRSNGIASTSPDYQLTGAGQQVMTMDEILFKLIDAAKLRCEESQRKLIMSQCGRAGVLRMKYQLLLRDGAAPPTAALYFLCAARRVYQSAVDTYSRNRRESLVLGYLSVDKGESGNFTLGALDRQRADCVSWLWTSTSDKLVDTMGDWKAGPVCNDDDDDGGISSTYFSSTGGAKRCRVDHCVSLEREFSSESPGAVVDVRHPNTGHKHVELRETLSCKFDLDIPRRLVACRYTLDVLGCVNAIRNRTIASADGESTGRYASRNGQNLCGIVVFPASLAVQCQEPIQGSGLLGDVHRFGIDDNFVRQILLSLKAKAGSSLPRSQYSGNFCSESYRSRAWRITAQSLLNSALAVYECACHPSDATAPSACPCMQCCRVLDLSKPCFGEDVMVAIGVKFQLYEAEFDIDLLQELHVSTNYCTTVEMSSSSRPEERLDNALTPVKRPRDSNCASHYDDADAVIESNVHTSTGLLSTMQARSEFLKKQYVSMAAQAKAGGSLRLLEAVTCTDRLTTQLEDEGGWGWLREVLHLIVSGSSKGGDARAMEEELLRRIHGAIECNGQAYLGCAGRLSDGQSLMVYLYEAVEALISTRKRVIAEVMSLPDSPSSKDMAENSVCGRCRADWGQTGSICKHCKLEDSINQLEHLLHSYRRQSKDRSTPKDAVELDLDGNEIRSVQREAFEVDGVGVFLTKMVWRFVGTHLPRLNAQRGQVAFNGPECLRVGRLAIETLTSMQKEIHWIQLVWRQHLHCLSAYDEVQQAVRPLQWMGLDQLGSGRGDQNDMSGNGIVMQGEEDERLEEFQLQVEVAKTDLTAAVGQLHYLKNLASSRLGLCDTDDTTAELAQTDSKECVICMENLADGECVVICCGHVLHRACLRWMLQRGQRGRQCRDSEGNRETQVLAGQIFKCPVCRKRCSETEVLLASRLSSDDKVLAGEISHSVRVSEAAVVKGQWGEKVRAIVEDLLQLVRTGEKAIVFSQWEQMLDILSAALQVNDICYEKVASKKLFDRSLVRFTCDPSVTVLLLPLKSGAQGLTVVEANHVFFVEPMLNLEQELQAMNRIHRIGQTRETFVHKYVMEDTVEVKIHDQFLRRYEGSDILHGVIEAGGAKKTKDDQSLLTLGDIRHILGRGGHSEEDKY